MTEVQVIEKLRIEFNIILRKKNVIIQYIITDDSIESWENIILNANLFLWSKTTISESPILI